MRGTCDATYALGVSLVSCSVKPLRRHKRAFFLGFGEIAAACLCDRTQRGTRMLSRVAAIWAAAHPESHLASSLELSMRSVATRRCRRQRWGHALDGTLVQLAIASIGRRG